MKQEEVRQVIDSMTEEEKKASDYCDICPIYPHIYGKSEGYPWMRGFSCPTDGTFCDEIAARYIKWKRERGRSWISDE